MTRLHKISRILPAFGEPIRETRSVLNELLRIRRRWTSSAWAAARALAVEVSAESTKPASIGVSARCDGSSYRSRSHQHGTCTLDDLPSIDRQHRGDPLKAGVSPGDRGEQSLRPASHAAGGDVVAGTVPRTCEATPGRRPRVGIGGSPRTAHRWHV